MRVLILTGAGISAESGVPTFRDADGLWEGHSFEEVATPEAFARDPDTVQRFYDARRAALAGVEPNPAHQALARLEEALGEDLLIVTQNVDDLHERAGSTRVLHMHGALTSALCGSCEQRHPWAEPLLHRPSCPGCGQAALRPDVVWFGELPYEMERVFEVLERTDLFVAIGTSGAVYPAAGFVRMAVTYGARTLELNLERTESSEYFDSARQGPASELVPAWVEVMLS